MSTSGGTVKRDELQALRARLDEADRGLLNSLGERVECCRQIAHVKRRTGVPMMQPHRIELVHDRAARFAREHGLEPTFVRRLYDLIIEETCRVETFVMGQGARE
jgi:chorismate mutase